MLYNILKSIIILLMGVSFSTYIWINLDIITILYPYIVDICILILGAYLLLKFNRIS